MKSLLYYFFSPFISRRSLRSAVDRRPLGDLHQLPGALVLRAEGFQGEEVTLSRLQPVHAPLQPQPLLHLQGGAKERHPLHQARPRR